MYERRMQKGKLIIFVKNLEDWNLRPDIEGKVLLRIDYPLHEYSRLGSIVNTNGIQNLI
jgi:hypothetical protein